MTAIFTAGDLLELALQVERNGFVFYGALSQSAKSQKVRQACHFLQGEEERHLAVFQRLLDSVGRQPLPESYPGEYQAYIEALAGSRVFSDEEAGRRLAQEAEGDAEALKVAIGFEKDTILFFTEMRLVLGPRDQPVVDELVRQEKAHIKKLVEVREQLARG